MSKASVLELKMIVKRFFVDNLYNLGDIKKRDKNTLFFNGFSMIFALEATCQPF